METKKPITAGELINHLQNYPKDTPIILNDYQGDYTAASLDEIKTMKVVFTDRKRTLGYVGEYADYKIFTDDYYGEPFTALLIGRELY